MPAFLTDRQWLAVLLAVFMAVALSACGGGGGGTAPMPEPEPMPPTAEEMCTDAGNHWVDGACMTPGEYTVQMTLASIAAAATAADAQAAYDAVKDQVTATQGEALQDAVDARVAALAAMDRAADQKAALMAAAGMIDTSDLSTQEAVDTARAANVALRAALDAADDVSDADKAMYQAQLDAAVAAVDDAQDGIDTATRRMNQMEALADASTALASALTALSGATPTQEQLDAANAALGDLNAAVTGGADLTDEEKGPYALQASNASAPIATAQAAYDAAEEKRLAGEARARQLVLNAASMQVAKAINAHTVADNPPDEFSFTDTDTVTAGNQALTVTRGSGAAKITPFQSAADKKRKPFATGTAQDAGTGWSGMTFTRSGTEAKKAFTEMAAVYTDIEAAKDALWATAFDGATGTGLGLTEGDGPVTMDATARVNASHFTGGILPVGPTGNDDTSTVELAAGQGRIGTFYGVSGRFSCAAACVVSRDDKGIVSVDTPMIFTPNAFDALTTMAKYATPDADYTQFGYWMKSTKQRDGSYNHDIETFHGGTGDLAADLTVITGSAKYYGAAAGVYVKKEGAGDSLVVSDGKFTADAMLTARFGGGSIAANKAFEVEGTISGFMDGSADLGFAALTLEAGDIDTTAGETTLGAITGGETQGGGTSGNWQGQFYGNAGAGTTDTAADDFPQNVSGEFNGHFVNGHVAGAFGAEKD